MEVKRVLIVDDERPCLLSLKESLQSDSITVETAEDFETALAMIAHRAFHVVVTDHWLCSERSRSGVEVLKYVKKNSPETKVVLMTGYAHGDFRKYVYGLGADILLEKPFSGAILRGLIERT